MRIAIRTLCLAAAFLCGSCGTVQTYVILYNSTSHTVEGRLFYDEEQALPASGLEALGTEVTFSIPAGQSFSFNRDCEDLQAIFIKDADLRVAPGISPDTESDVYSEPDDFTCGRTLTFTFTQNALGTELNVTFALAP